MTRTVISALIAGLLGFASAAPPILAAEDEKTGAANPVLAVVNGAKITRAEFDEARQRLPQQLQGLPEATVYMLLLNSLIDTSLVAREARKDGLHKEAAFRKRLVRLENQLLERDYLNRYITERLTEKELQRRYEKLVEKAKGEQELRARHVLLKTKSDALDVIKKIDGGADFAQVARERSTGPSASNGGDLNYFTFETMVPEFAVAAFALDKGDYTRDPVKTQFGWHVIKVVDKRPAPVPTIEASRDTLLQEATRDFGSGLIRNLREKADIKTFGPDGSPLDKPKPTQ